MQELLGIGLSTDQLWSELHHSCEAEQQYWSPGLSVHLTGQQEEVL